MNKTKEFLKENWFNLGILIAVLIIGLAYVSLQKQLKGDNLISKIKCQEEGERIDQQQVQGEGFYLKSEYYFNKKLNTCLYSSIYIYIYTNKDGEVVRYIDRSIIDVYTNKTLVHYSALNNTHTTGVPLEEFGKEKERLFSN